MEKNYTINETLIREMANEGKRITDDNGYVYSISKDEDNGYLYLGRFLPGEGGNCLPFGKRLNGKTIEKMIAYFEDNWNKE